MRFQEIHRQPDEPPSVRKLFSERGLWELVVERDGHGLRLDLWWTAWPYARVVGYCMSLEPGRDQQVVDAIIHALDSVPEEARGWDVELYLPPAEPESHPVDPRTFATLPRFTGSASGPAQGG